MLRAFQKLLWHANPVHVKVQKPGITIGEYEALFQEPVANVSQDACDDESLSSFVECIFSQVCTIGLFESQEPQAGTLKRYTFTGVERLSMIILKCKSYLATNMGSKIF